MIWFFFIRKRKLYIFGRGKYLRAKCAVFEILIFQTIFLIFISLRRTSFDTFLRFFPSSLSFPRCFLFSYLFKRSHEESPSALIIFSYIRLSNSLSSVIRLDSGQVSVVANLCRSWNLYFFLTWVGNIKNRENQTKPNLEFHRFLEELL